MSDADRTESKNEALIPCTRRLLHNQNTGTTNSHQGQHWNPNLLRNWYVESISPIQRFFVGLNRMSVPFHEIIRWKTTPELKYINVWVHQLLRWWFIWFHLAIACAHPSSLPKRAADVHRLFGYLISLSQIENVSYYFILFYIYFTVICVTGLIHTDYLFVHAGMSKNAASFPASSISLQQHSMTALEA